MKKQLTGFIIATAGFAACVPFISASAADTIKVDVTICNAGEIAVPAKQVMVTDRNSDGKFDIDETLYAAHEAYYEGGAASGYASEKTDLGLSLKTLWGVTNGGGYGYYVSNHFAMGLADEVKDGDSVSAFVYSDTATWKDCYSFFDVQNMPDAEVGKELPLALRVIHFDADFQPVADPCANATIIVDGEKTAYKTDETGQVMFIPSRSGEMILSAVSDKEILVPTVLRVTVKPAESTVSTEAAVTTEAETVTTTRTTAEVTSGTAAIGTTNGTAATSSAAATTTKAAAAVTTTAKASGSGSTSAAKTGESAAIPALALTAALACGAAYGLRRRND